jgi:hypothetical protein
MLRALVALLGCVLGLAAPPSTLRIGGLFSIMDEQGNINLAGAQQQAAFLMAIRELNDKSDGVMDDILPNTEIKFASRHVVSRTDAIERSLDLVYVDMDGSSGVDIVVNALGPALSSAENDILDSRDIPSVRAVYADQVLSRPSQISVVPFASRQVSALAHVVCGYNIQKNIVIIMEGSDYGVGMMEELMHNVFCDFNAISTLVLAPSSFSLMDQMRELYSINAVTFFILVKDPALAAKVLETGFELDIFRMGRELFLSDEVMSSPTLYDSFQDASVVDAVMRGSLGMSYDTLYHVAFSDVGSAFFTRWHNQRNTSASALGICDDDIDDSTDPYYLFSNQERTICVGFDFPDFNSVAKLDRDVASVYDAVISVALGVHFLVEEQSAGMAVTSEDFKSAIVQGLNWYEYEGTILFTMITVWQRYLISCV